MDRIINTVKNCLEIKDFYSALYVSLALVGACSVKQYPTINGKNKRIDKERYTKWIEEFYLPLFEEDISKPMIESIVIYKLRCSILHESTSVLQTNQQNNVIKIILTHTGSHRNKSIFISGSTQINEIQVDVKCFVEELIESIDSWKLDAERNGIETNCDFTIFNDSWSSTKVEGAQGFHNCK